MNDQTVSTIKSIIKQLHTDENADRRELSQRFQAIAGGASARDIATAEQEAIEEGIPLESVRKLCDVHLDMFTDEAKQARADLPEGHPVSILYAEHDTLLGQIRAARKVLLPEERSEPEVAEIVHAVQQTLHVMDAAKRYFEKEENALFPVIERYGITRPPAVMWSEHDSLRDIFREFRDLGPGDRERAGQLLLMAEEILTAHIHKEETILFRTALDTIRSDEWREIRRDFDELGYMHATPAVWAPSGEPDDEPGAEHAQARSRPKADDQSRAQSTRVDNLPDGATITLPSGSLSGRQLLAILNSLPIDLTFVDENDTVVYFSETPARIFPRARSVIGRNVRNCHPPRSLHVVEEILRSFHAGERDVEEFYLHLGERYVYIRYFALRSESGEYMGCLEVSQDIAPIQAITGEKRILSEDGR